VKTTWFGHFCFRTVAGASSILIDPLLSGNATLEEAGLSGDAWGGLVAPS
jgi:L-ascorbate metabolism protein UlaG (beta-lactamase superfamily)